MSNDVLVGRILNYYPNYPTQRLYFWEVETPYIGSSLSASTHLHFRQDKNLYLHQLEATRLA